VLGHRRLAIIDLNSRAAQPMTSRCGRYIAVFNGEIYNHRELRVRLQRDGVAFRTNSDTEVLVELFARRGVEALCDLRGMFGLAVWDRHTGRALVARDPYGIKPVYIAKTGHGILVGSQVRALLATGLVSRTPCARGQAGFWMLGSVPEPFTWFEDVQCLPAGHYAWIENGAVSSSKCWWSITDAWSLANGDRAPGLVREGVREALQRSVAAHMVSDVPVAVLLSGGVDSGALAGLMRDTGITDVQGVTIAYDEFANTPSDETPGASLLARHYGIRHHIRRVGQEEFTSDLPRILDAMDQPSIDGVNTWYAAKAVSELQLKVVVSGIGGDELFQGYDSFRVLPRLVSGWQLASRVPGLKAIAEAASQIQAWRTGNSRWRHAPEWASSVAGAWWLRRSLFGPEDLNALMGNVPVVVDGVDLTDTRCWIRALAEKLPPNPRLALSAIESAQYLRNQLLRDSDWASMDHSVELRTPFVDAWLLREVQPMLGAFEHFPQKRLIGEAPSKPLPEALMRKQKTGFGIPVERWIHLPQHRRGGTHSQSWAMRVAAAYLP
jgi:asparagine synthase (glutamine-hydrolysing)